MDSYVKRTSNLFHKKYSQKCSDSNDFPCNILKLTKRKKRLNQRFSSVLIRIECLLNFCKE